MLGVQAEWSDLLLPAAEFDRGRRLRLRAADDLDLN
jgi:hypothetical protein